MFVPLSVLGAVFAGQVAKVIEYLRAQTDVSYPELVHRLQSYPLIGNSVEWVQENTTISAQQVQGWLTDGLQAQLKTAASMGGSVALNVFGTLIGFRSRGSRPRPASSSKRRAKESSGSTILPAERLPLTTTARTARGRRLRSLMPGKPES